MQLECASTLRFGILDWLFYCVDSLRDPLYLPRNQFRKVYHRVSRIDNSMLPILAISKCRNLYWFLSWLFVSWSNTGCETPIIWDIRTFFLDKMPSNRGPNVNPLPQPLVLLQSWVELMMAPSWNRKKNPIFRWDRNVLPGMDQLTPFALVVTSTQRKMVCSTVRGLTESTANAIHQARAWRWRTESQRHALAWNMPTNRSCADSAEKITSASNTGNAINNVY